MSYRQPAIRITQVFQNTQAALAVFALPHVNIGPAFQVVTQAKHGTTYTGSLINLSYVNQIAGTFVDTREADPSDLTSFPVKIDLSNVVVELISQPGAGAVNPYNSNQFTDATISIFQNVVAGDVIVVTGSLMGNNGNYTVRSRVNNNTLQTNETFAAVESGINYTIRRNIQSTLGTINIPRSTVGVVISDITVTIPGGLTTVVAPFGAKPILSADVLLSYRALRVEKSANVWNYPFQGGVSQLQSDFGLDQIVPENPVVFAAYISLSNAAVDTNLLALNQTYFTDEGQSYLNAFGIVQLTDMYALSVLTHSTSVHTSLKAYIDTVSAPAKMQECVGIVNRRLVTTVVVVDSIVTGGSEGLGGTGNLTLTSAASHFITDGVVPGQFVVIAAPSNAKGRFEIASVTSQTQLVLKAPGPGVAATGVEFLVDRDLQAIEQAQVLAAYASSIADRRMIITWPDVVSLPVGSSVKQVPGYFLNAAVAALTTGLPTQQGLTNLSIAQFTGVVHSTKYFTNDQLNIIAGGGVMIFVQDVLNQTPLFCRHQLTSDTSAIKFQEYSITKNVDFIAKFIRQNQQKFLGQYNIIDTTLDDLKHSANGMITFLRDNTRLPKIGGVIRSGKLVKLEQDSVNIDSTIEQFQLDIPVPLNNLDITLYV